MEPDTSTMQLHVVNDAGGSVVVRSAPVQRESARAIYLETPLVPIGGYYPKRLFVKGVDLIAYTEADALRLYLQQLEVRLTDMERVLADFRRRQKEGTEQLRSLSEQQAV